MDKPNTCGRPTTHISPDQSRSAQSAPQLSTQASPGRESKDKNQTELQSGAKVNVSSNTS